MKKKIISFLMVMVICLTMPGCFDMAPGGGEVKAADKSAHDFLFNRILSVVNSNYKAVDFDYAKSLYNK